MSVANDNDRSSGKETPALAPCPICRKPAVDAYKPFCSKRCADVDLGRWLGGVYAIPAAPALDDDEDESPVRAPRPTAED